MSKIDFRSFAEAVGITNRTLMKLVKERKIPHHNFQLNGKLDYESIFFDEETIEQVQEMFFVPAKADDDQDARPLIRGFQTV